MLPLLWVCLLLHSLLTPPPPLRHRLLLHRPPMQHRQKLNTTRNIKKPLSRKLRPLKSNKKEAKADAAKPVAQKAQAAKKHKKEASKPVAQKAQAAKKHKKHVKHEAAKPAAQPAA